MTQFKKAKQYYHHKEFQKAIELIIELISSKVVMNNSIDYPDIMCYLGDSRLGLFETAKNKSLVYEAVTDYATGANPLLVFHQTTSTDLNKRLKKCMEML